MRIILMGMGTDGDVFPMIALGACLRSRGHEVVLAANARYRSFATLHGFGFGELVSERDTESLLLNPHIWHPLKSATHGARWGRPLIQSQFKLLLELAGSHDAVLVGAPAIFAGRIVQEVRGCPLISVVPMPWMLLSSEAPPLLAGPFNLPAWAPKGLVKVQWHLMEHVAHLLMGREVNRIRRSVGLAPTPNVVRWSYSPQLTIGLFPSWYGPPQPDWPRNTRLTGFPLFDGGHMKELPVALEEFRRAGPPPVVFSFGTGMMHGATLFRNAIEVCRITGFRGVFLTRHRAQIPADLPPGIHWSEYASFRELLPGCAAIVHHGGIGTASQALAAATPQLILPHAWDQPDNAARLQRLGVARSVPPRSSPRRIAEQLLEVTRDEVRETCRAIQQRIRGDTGMTAAAAWIEECGRAERNTV